MSFAIREYDSKCICTIIEEEQDHQDHEVIQDRQVHQDNQDQVDNGEDPDHLVRVDHQENLVLKATKDLKDHLVRTQELICL